MNKEQLLEKLDNLNFKEHTTDYIYYYLCEIGKEADICGFPDNFITYEKLDDIVRAILNVHGVRGVKAALDGVMDLSHTFYYRDDDNKFRNVTKNDLEFLRYALKICIEE